MKLYVENFREEEKINTFSEQKAHNLETLGAIHKKNATLLETSLLKHYGKRSSSHP